MLSSLFDLMWFMVDFIYYIGVRVEGRVGVDCG